MKCVLQNLEEESDSNSSGWVDLFDPPIITSDKRHYLLRLPVNDGKNGAFRQIAMITINVRRSVRFIDTDIY